MSEQETSSVTAGQGGCTICATLGGLAGERLIWRDGRFAAYAEGERVPGWLIFTSERHAEGIWALRSDELASLGPALAQVAGAMREALGAERVYFLSLGESAAHYHGLLVPRYGDDLALAGGIGAAIAGRFLDETSVVEGEYERVTGAIRDAASSA